jgi:outer membrane receptor protein involved in Fe transport
MLLHPGSRSSKPSRAGPRCGRDGLQYRRKKWEYDLNVVNLFDRRYWVSAIDDTQVYPGPPINVSGTIRYRF